MLIPKLPPKTITYRAVNKINLAQFKNDLAKSDLLTSTCSNTASLYQLYHTTLSSLLNKHAPIKTRICSSRPKEPWMSEAILVEKRKKRQLERAWRHSKLQYMHRCLTRQVHYFNHIVSQAKSDWYTRLIDKNKNKPRNLWQGINRILHRSQSSPLPDFSDCTSLSIRFGTYFQDKISKIREILDTKDCSGEQVKPNYSPPYLPKFTPVSEDEVRKLISSSPNKFL